MSPLAWMAAIFVALVWVCLLSAWRIADRRPMAADSLFWAATVLSVFAVFALLSHLSVEVLL